VARRATLIGDVRASGTATLVLDAGNALINDREPALSSRGATSVSALNRLGYDAVALGLTDLTQLTLDELRARLAEAEFPFLSANVTLRETGELLAEPYVVVPMNGHQVGILGLTAAGETDALIAGDPVAAAQTWLAELAPQAEVIIVLSNAGPEANRAIAESQAGVDLVIGGADPDLYSELYLPASGALLLPGQSARAGAAGERMGLVELTFDRAGYVTAHQWRAVDISAEDYAEDAEMARWVQEITSEVGGDQ
jgi:2',3'-cyclic-nucleotide 2'-phosphodiesterase (5'-nucleotidase family)